MKQKVLVVFLVFFGIQLIGSCCSNNTYEFTINSFEISALKLEGTNYVEISNPSSVNMEAFFLEIFFNGTEELISEFNKNVSKLGFQSAYAANQINFN